VKISAASSSIAPIILVYGNEGRGKTTLACKAPKPVALLLEHGLPKGVTIDSVEDVNSFDKILAVLRELYTDSRGYQSLIIVLLTSLFTGMVFSLESALTAVQYGFGKPEIEYDLDLNRRKAVGHIGLGFHLFYDVGAVGNSGVPMQARHSAGFGFGSPNASSFFIELGFPIRSTGFEPTFSTGFRF